MHVVSSSVECKGSIASHCMHGRGLWYNLGEEKIGKKKSYKGEHKVKCGTERVSRGHIRDVQCFVPPLLPAEMGSPVVCGLPVMR